MNHGKQYTLYSRMPSSKEKERNHTSLLFINNGHRPVIVSTNILFPALFLPTTAICSPAASVIFTGSFIRYSDGGSHTIFYRNNILHYKSFFFFIQQDAKVTK